MSDDADEIAELASWTDGIEANRAMPVGYGAPENAEIKKRFDLIVRDLHSWIDVELIWNKLKTGTLEIYWGTATTGRPHLGYFVPIYKIADFLKAGCNVKILFADVHGFLDNMKSSWELLEHRCNYYTYIIKTMLQQIGVDVEDKEPAAGMGRLTFVRGSSYQLTPAFTLDVYKMSTQVTTNEAVRAGAEVVKQQATPLLSSLLYPILQALDEEHLKCDVQFGGVDQRKIFMFSRDNSPKCGFVKRGYLMNPLIPGLGKSGKMSSSEPLSKIDFDDSEATLRSKIKKAFCVPIEDVPENKRKAAMNNGLLAISKFLLFRWLEDNSSEGEQSGLTIKDKLYTDFQSLSDGYASGEIYPSELKPPIADGLERLLKPIRAAVASGSKGGELLAKAYPDVAKKNAKLAQQRAAASKSAVTWSSARVVVGKVGATEPVEDSDLLSASVDVGTDKPVRVVSDLLKSDSLVVLVANAGSSFPKKGVRSEMQVVYAKVDDNTCIALQAPADTAPGTAVVAPGFDGKPEKQMKRQWTKIQAKLSTDDNGAPQYDGVTLTVDGKPLLSLDAAKNAPIDK